MNRREFVSASALLLPLRGIAESSWHTLSPDNETLLSSSSARGWVIPRPMYWSFDNKDPLFHMAGYFFAFQVFTTGLNENSFSVDRNSVIEKQDGNRWTIQAAQLSWPGQQQTAPGTLHAEVTLSADSVILRVKATAAEPVRGIKVSIRRLQAGKVAQTGWQVTPNLSPVTEDGVTYSYPTYTGGMPVWFLGTNTTGVSFSSVDTHLTPKRFAAHLRSDGVEVQLITEQNAQQLSTSYEAPAWEIRQRTTLQQALESRMSLLESQTGLQPWEARSDIPPWALDLTLVVTLHGMHWSGYIFNDYARMLAAVRWVTQRIEGRRVLFFIAGWEGRYYRQYGDSRPDERMGAADGLQQLVRGVHATGAHIMAMFAGNNSNQNLPNFESYGHDSGFHALHGHLDWSPMRGYQVDWAEIRAGAEGGVWLNPGAPAWRDHLIDQISGLASTFGFDGAFLDTQPNGDNDYRNNPLDGLRTIADTLRERHPGFLMATESWFDLSLSIIPMSQTPDGPYHWSRRYQRRFAHLALGEPSRGSTGVHELGTVPYDLADLLTTFDLPTVSMVEDTYEVAPEKVQAVLNAAKRIKNSSSITRSGLAR